MSCVKLDRSNPTPQSTVIGSWRGRSRHRNTFGQRTNGGVERVDHAADAPHGMKAAADQVGLRRHELVVAVGQVELRQTGAAHRSPAPRPPAPHQRRSPGGGLSRVVADRRPQVGPGQRPMSLSVSVGVFVGDRQAQQLPRPAQRRPAVIRAPRRRRQAVAGLPQTTGRRRRQAEQNAPGARPRPSAPQCAPGRPDTGMSGARRGHRRCPRLPGRRNRPRNELRQATGGPAGRSAIIGSGSRRAGVI